MSLIRAKKQYPARFCRDNHHQCQCKKASSIPPSKLKATVTTLNNKPPKTTLPLSANPHQEATTNSTTTTNPCKKPPRALMPRRSNPRRHRQRSLPRRSCPPSIISTTSSNISASAPTKPFTALEEAMASNKDDRATLDEA